jgi:predicted N-acetyltransferase YhbS
MESESHWELARSLLARGEGVVLCSTAAEEAPLGQIVRVREPGVGERAFCFESSSSELVSGRVARLIAEECVGPVVVPSRREPLVLGRTASALGNLVAQGPGRWCLEPTKVESRSQLGQSLPAPTKAELLEALWSRGAAGDLEMLEQIRTSSPEMPTPSFLRAPSGASLHVVLSKTDIDRAVELLSGAYWNQALPVERVRRAVEQTQVRVGARDERGVLIAHARALTDTVKYAWIYDVIVDERWRGRGLGQAIVRLLLDHPTVRNARSVLLGTRDAQTLYARFGFRDRREVPPLGPWTSTEMVLRRSI